MALTREDGCFISVTFANSVPALLLVVLRREQWARNEL